MKNIAITGLVLASFLSAGMSIAADKKTKKKAKAAVSQDAPAAEEEHSAPTHYSSHTSGGSDVGDLRWSVSGPFTLIDGSMYFGAYVDGLYRLNKDFSVGGESGFMIHSESVGTVSVTVWNIPILAKGVYYIPMSSGDILPFVSAAVGLGIVHGSASVAVPGSSDTSVKFEALFGGGAYFGQAKNFFAEVKFGTMSSSFALAPTVGWRF